MPILQSEARALLTPYFPAFTSAMASAWDRYTAEIGDWRPAMTERSRASIVHDLTVESAIQQFEGVAGVRVEDRNRLYLFIFHDKVAVRFKKFDETKRSRNIPTQATFNFLAQQEIPGIPSTLHLEAGYVLNKLQTEIEGYYIVCPSGDDVRWFWELQNAGPGNVFQFPISIVPQQPSIFTLNISSMEQEAEGSEE